MKKIILSTIYCLGILTLYAQNITFFNIQTDIEVNKAASDNALKQIIGLPEQIEISKEPNQVFVDKLSMTHSKYNLSYQGIPIEFSTIITHSNNNNKIVSINGEFFEGLDNISSNTPSLSNEAGLNVALEHIKSIKYVWEDNLRNYAYLNQLGKAYLKNKPKGELVFCGNYQDKEDRTIHLAYKFNIWSVEPFRKDLIYIDANNGKILLETSLINNVDGTADTRYSGQQTVATNTTSNQFRLRDYDNNRGNGIETYNGTIGTDFFDDDNNWTDAEYNNTNFDNAALDAHWGAMMTYDYFSQIHGRDSYDDNGGAIINIVHRLNGFGNPWDNAFWDPATLTLNFGDGVADFSPLTSLDVCAHEFGHGLDQFTSGLIYINESGALDESFADIWGVCVENFVNPNRDIWQIGEQIMANGRPALRSMSNPNQENDPDTYRGNNWATGSVDNGGVHTNSGVGNHWFFLLSAGGTGTNDNGDNFNVGAVSIENSEQIAYRALTVYFTPNTPYTIARELTIQAAVDLFEACSQEVVSTTNAWYAVGVGDIFQQDEDLFLTQAIVPDINEVFIAENNIEATNTIDVNTNITYIAGNSIVLKPGFKVIREANFNALIQICNNLNFGKRNDGQERTTSKPLKEEKKHSFNIYPNPTSNIITINLEEDFILNGEVQVSIYNSVGTKMLFKNFYMSSFDIDLSFLTSGVYFIEIMSNKNKHQSKIIKQ